MNNTVNGTKKEGHDRHGVAESSGVFQNECTST